MSKRIITRSVLALFLLWCAFAANAERYTIPLLVPPGATGDPQGTVRILNDAQESATVTIYAIDDAGVRTGPATLLLDPLVAVELSATELESGDSAKGLSSGLGRLSGEVRLVIDSDVPVVPSTYVRNADGTLSAMNATVLEAISPGRDAYHYDVPVFHPASNATQPSRLRLINPGEAPVQVTIAARDDTGAAATGGTAELTLPAGGARTLSAQQLEAGDPARFTGRLGAGVGNWRLSVTSDRPLLTIHVTEASGTGRWSNLSTTAVSGWAPESATSFEARFLQRAILFRDGQERVEWRVVAENRLSVTEMEDGVEGVVEAAFRYERIGRDAGRLSFQPDGGAHCEMRVYFESPSSGWHAFGCVENVDRVEYWTGGTWVALDAGATPLDLGSGPDDLTYTVDTAIEALTLPAASGGDGTPTYNLSPQVPGLNFDPQTRRLSGTPSEAGEYLMTYRVRDTSGDTDWRYFNIAVEAASGGGQETTFGVGDTLSDLPTGSWTPDVTSDGSFSLSGGDATVRLDEGGYIEEGDYRYTCQSSGGCIIENRSVTSGSVVQTAKGAAPGAGSGVSDDHGDDRATATGVEAGSDTEGMLESGDVDYFRIDVDASGTLEVYSSGRTDTYGYLEDAGGETLRSNDDGGAGTNFRIAEDVSAGTYYVRVRGYSSRTTGDYTLSVRFTGSRGTDTSPSFAGVQGPGNRTYNVGMAIAALTLPEANGGDGSLTYSLSPEVPGLSFSATTRRLTGAPTTAGNYNMTYTVTDEDGDTDTLGFSITIESTGGGGATPTFKAGDTLNDLPTGFWTPDVTSGGSFGSSGGNVTIELDEGGYVEEGDYRYTCQSAAGCRIENRSVISGTIARTSKGTASGGDGTGTDAQPNFATESNPGDQSYFVGMAIDALTLPEASGGDGPLTYSLSPSVPGLNFNATATVRRLTGTPTSAGTYDMTYRVRDTDGDTDSLTFTVTVVDTADSGSVGSFDLHDDNSYASGIAYGNGRFYVLDDYWRGQKVYAYSETGARDGSADFDLHDDNSSPERIAYANGLFFVVDGSDDKVYAYTETGAREASADFDLHDDNSFPTGIAYGNGRFYIVDRSDDRVYAYTETGAHDASADFDLHYPENLQAEGIAYANGRLHVVDGDDKVYAYWSHSGQRDTSAEFDLHDDHWTAEGIAYGNGRFYIVDYVNDRVFYYPEIAVPDGPDLMASSASVSASELSAGTSYTLSAVVRNRGNQPSAATTLRYFRSSDPIISATDTEIGTDVVGGLSAGATSDESINLTAPSENDCYYCGACIDAVDGESTTSNNCSNPVLVAVGEQADLSVSFASLDAPSSGTVGVSPIYMSVEVTNRGQVASPPSKLIFSGGRSFSVDIPVLAPGETIRFDQNVGTVQIGSSTYYACIDFPCDPTSQNNCRSRSVTYF